MHQFYKRLFSGDQETARWLASAGDFFSDYFEGKRDWDSEQFARDLSMKQPAYEHHLNWDRWDAKTSMPFAALSVLYDDDVCFDDNAPLAREVAKGFLKSTCSIEVKSAARRAIEAYGLDDDNDPELRALRNRIF